MSQVGRGGGATNRVLRLARGTKTNIVVGSDEHKNNRVVGPDGEATSIGEVRPARGDKTKGVDESTWGVGKPWGYGAYGGLRNHEDFGWLVETGKQVYMGQLWEKRGCYPGHRQMPQTMVEPKRAQYPST